MACRDTLNFIQPETAPFPAPAVADENVNEITDTAAANDAPTNIPTGSPVSNIYFGVDSASPASTNLQHNLTHFEWVLRNKIYPNFWGRYIGGANGITREELDFIHYDIGCKVAALFGDFDAGNVSSEESGQTDGQKAAIAALDLGFYTGNAIFLDIGASNISAEYMQGYALALLAVGFKPGFYANTDAHFGFCHECSRGHQNNPELFSQCLIWATAPNLPEFTATANAHILYPDDWGPYCPSCFRKEQIAVWQYGSNSHPIRDYRGNHTSFNLNIIKDSAIIVEAMF